MVAKSDGDTFSNNGTDISLDFAWVNTAGVGASTVVDTLIAVTLMYSLHKTRTGIKHTNLLTEYVPKLQTSAFSWNDTHPYPESITNILGFIFSLLMPNNLIYVGVNIVGTRLYANSMMAALNSCQSLVERSKDGASQSSPGFIPMSTFAEASRRGQSDPLMCVPIDMTTFLYVQNALSRIDVLVTKEPFGSDVKTQDGSFEP
ncbi:uncharacterized protein BXZ73DRAFT_75814 [Epithele typhae]|uniref:uncharacterized protein n=1 Tax=Epithele typhae TaxID=378194 RepID=UPI002008DC7C|nr:uncharacterized protein BXZ73DRAFT_75814 [Epithele typhae]KAH9939606.1 hypothetical protein BXZ73DRAFT_75814 [Epithele typhae]